MPTPSGFIPLASWREYPPEEMLRRARAFAAELDRRRTVRQFSDRPIPDGVIEACLQAAGTAPSGAHLQPWHFVVVRDAERKRRIREAAEEAERKFYAEAPQDWLDALAPLGTDEHKPYLETAPCLIAVFAQRYGLNSDGSRRTHYYVSESVGIATGMLITALHHAGLVTLTHTPSPMGFLSTLLERPANERALMLIVTGYPAADAHVPALQRKRLEEYVTGLQDAPPIPRS
jgi:nitroreductase